MTKQLKLQFNVFFISDGTGITAESFGQSLLAQFDKIKLIKTTRPYINTIEKAYELTQEFEDIFNKTQQKPIVFSTIVDEKIAVIIRNSSIHLYDIFNSFIPSLEELFKKTAVHKIGKKREILSSKLYDKRIGAINFALNNDDGINVDHYSKADIILVGVSRSGKTPTCLYLGLQFCINAANYPLTEEDLSSELLPANLTKHKKKLFGLTIDPSRLNAIREERRPRSEYASLQRCKKEIKLAENHFYSYQIPTINTSRYSIEEIATRILICTGIERKIK